MAATKKVTCGNCGKVLPNGHAFLLHILYRVCYTDAEMAALERRLDSQRV